MTNELRIVFKTTDSNGREHELIDIIDVSFPGKTPEGLTETIIEDLRKYLYISTPTLQRYKRTI